MGQSGVMMRGRESRGERWERRRKLGRAFLVIIRPVTSSRFLAGGVWAVRAENASSPCIRVKRALYAKPAIVNSDAGIA